MRKSNWQGKIQQWAAGQRQDEKKRGTGSGSRTQEQKGEVQGRKKKKNHSSMGKRGGQGRGRKGPGCRTGVTWPQAWDSLQLLLSALLGDSATSDASLSFSPPFLFRDFGRLAVLHLRENVRVSQLLQNEAPWTHVASLARTLHSRTVLLATYTDAVGHAGSLACCGLRKWILPHLERQALSCLQWEAAASQPVFDFVFFSLLWPLQLQPRQLLSAASKHSASPFSPPRREESKARQRQPTQAWSRRS